MSKAALADLAWDLASQMVESADDHDSVMERFRAGRAIVALHRGDK